MPRLTPATLRYASRISPYLPHLLKECRDIDSAKNELRWLREFVAETQHPSPNAATAPISVGAKSAAQHRVRPDGTLLESYVKRRARGEPLQYILGTQPFGDLEILCRPNVLIPRPETETYTAETARLVRRFQCIDDAHSLRVADFCTGSGCISLLLHSILRSPRRTHTDDDARQLQIQGFDVSPDALKLARDNLHHNITLKTLHEDAASAVRFEELDVLALARQTREVILDRLYTSCPQDRSARRPFDIIISNPPYISPDDFKAGGRTTRSVRRYEPELALVPPAALKFESVHRADQFYAALLQISSATMPKLLLMEVGDTEQALRVRDFCKKYLHESSGAGAGAHDSGESLPLIEIWRDDGSIVTEAHDTFSGISSTGDQTDSHLVEIHTDIDADTHVDCRAVVVWFDPVWSQHRRNNRKQ